MIKIIGCIICRPISLLTSNWQRIYVYKINGVVMNKTFVLVLDRMKFMKFSLKFSLKNFNEIFTPQTFMKFSISRRT